jgi:hypothetical protein
MFSLLQDGYSRTFDSFVHSFIHLVYIELPTIERGVSHTAGGKTKNKTKQPHRPVLSTSWYIFVLYKVLCIPLSCQAWRLMPIIPATWEAEIERIAV